MSRLASLGVLRLESHVRVGDGIAASSSFPNWLRAAGDNVDALGLVLPLLPARQQAAGSGDMHCELRRADRLFGIANCRGTWRVVRNLPQLVLQLVRLRRFTDTVLMRAPEHLNAVLPALLWMFRFKVVMWFVHDRAEVESAMRARHGRRFGIRAALLLSRIHGCAERFWARRFPVIANGSAIQRRLVEAGVDPGRILTIVSSTLSRTQLAQPLPEWSRPAGAGLEILYVGRLALEKGLVDLIEALRLHAAAGGSPARLTLVGWSSKGEQESLASQVRAAGLEDRVHFAGPVPYGPRLFEHYQRAHLFVLPSWSEGTPRVLVEAMAMGRPVVATRVGGVGDLIADGVNGILVEPRASAALAAAIARLDGDAQLCRRMSAANRERAHSLTTEALAARMCAFIRATTAH